MRYIERIDNYDMEKLIKYLSNDQKLKDTLEIVGTDAQVAIDDCILVIKNNTIVTIKGKTK